MELIHHRTVFMQRDSKLDYDTKGFERSQTL